ncbi:MAG: hypothetical protein AAGF11_28625 [Myxococcota bacterium]
MRCTANRASLRAPARASHRARGRTLALAPSRARPGPWLTLVTVVTLGPLACTEPNPYLPAGTSTTATGNPGTPPTPPSSTTVPPALDSSDTTADVSECVAAGMECIARAPEGWAGPFAWLERPVAQPIACAAPWDEPLIEAFSEISAPAARCGCECGSFIVGNCLPGSVTHYEGAGCVGDVLDITELEPGCNVLQPPESSTGSFRFESPITRGVCGVIPSMTLEEPSFLNHHVACGGQPLPLACPNAMWCVPRPDDPFYPRVCIWHEGDQDCPAGGPYSESQRLFRSIDDSRDCMPCSCTLPRGPCVDTSLSLAAAPDCSNTFGSLDPDGCTAVVMGEQISGYLYEPGLASGECEPSAVVPIGNAAGAEPLTFCCTP